MSPDTSCRRRRSHKPLASVPEGSDEHAEQYEQRQTDAADAYSLQDPTGLGVKAAVGSDDQQRADHPERGGDDGDDELGGELVDEAAVTVGGKQVNSDGDVVAFDGPENAIEAARQGGKCGNQAREERLELVTW